MILIVDNFDSFVYNLARYLQRLGQETVVVRNDATDVARVRAMKPQAIVLSPGPCTPREAGCSLELVRKLAGEIPMLGVCLGHQVIGEACGGKIVRAPQPMHGRTSTIEHDQQGLFAGLPSTLTVGRYHSLVIEESTLPTSLKVTARTAEGVVMAIAHREWQLYGVQFHPEAILTEGGFTLLANFLRLADCSLPTCLPEVGEERPATSEGWQPAHNRPPPTF